MLKNAKVNFTSDDIATEMSKNQYQNLHFDTPKPRQGDKEMGCVESHCYKHRRKP